MNKRLLGDENGAAMVEFAIVSIVTVVLFMWSHLFLDIILTRMKVLEAARAAVFEFTAYDLSDYDNGTPGANATRFSAVQQSVQNDLQSGSNGNRGIFQTALDSSYIYKCRGGKTGPGCDPNARPFTFDSFTIRPFAFSNQSELSNILNGFISFAMGYTSLVPGNIFNKNGYVQATVSAGFTSRYAPTQTVFGGTIKKVPFVGMMTEQLHLITDSWKLEDGSNVDTTGNYSSAGNVLITRANSTGQRRTAGQTSTFQSQVGRMGMLGKATVPTPDPSLAIYILPAASGITQTHLATINFLDMVPSLPGRDGASRLNAPTPSVSSFFTAPFCSQVGIAPACGPYSQAYSMRGNNFMGCKQPHIAYDGQYLQNCFNATPSP